MELFLVRHGETESNKAKKYQGWSESPLSEKGMRQAEDAGSFLAGKNITAIYSSDLGRARHTAKVIGMGCGLSPKATSMLREIHFGDWEGLTYQEIEAGWGTQISSWLDNPFLRSAPGGETLADVCRRMENFLKAISSTSNGQKIVVVSHGGSIRALLFRLMKFAPEDFWQIRVDNASISLVQRVGEHDYKVVYYNRTDHIAAKSIKGGDPDNS